MRIIGLIFAFFLLFATASFGENTGDNQNSEQTNCNIEKEECAQCPYAGGSNSEKSNTSGIITLSLILGLATYYFFRLYDKKYILVLGGFAVIFLIASSFIRPSASTMETCIVLADSTKADVFLEPGDEFISEDTSLDEFVEVNDEFSAVESSDEIKNADEFSTVDDEFTEDISEFSETSQTSDSKRKEKNKKHFTELGILLFLLVIIGIGINNSTFRKLRPLFLIAMVVWLGFMRGGCPCMISSFHNTVLAGLGNDVSWISLLWFLGLIPVTYFLGKIWCGWLCHLGGFQEFLFAATKIEFLKKAKHQKVIKGIQIAVFIILIVQLAITNTNIFIHYDPFKVAFNLFSATTTGYILLAILLLSSVLVYRPFCRAFCPVGLILGLVAMLPKAKRVIKNNECIDCIKCSKSCKSRAIIYENKTSVLNISDCIACGDCLDSCHKNALKFTTKPAWTGQIKK